MNNQRQLDNLKLGSALATLKLQIETQDTQDDNRKDNAIYMDKLTEMSRNLMNRASERIWSVVMTDHHTADMLANDIMNITEDLRLLTPITTTSSHSGQLAFVYTLDGALAKDNGNNPDIF